MKFLQDRVVSLTHQVTPPVHGGLDPSLVAENTNDVIYLVHAHNALHHQNEDAILQGNIQDDVTNRQWAGMMKQDKKEDPLRNRLQPSHDQVACGVRVIKASRWGYHPRSLSPTYHTLDGARTRIHRIKKHMSRGSRGAKKGSGKGSNKSSVVGSARDSAKSKHTQGRSVLDTPSRFTELQQKVVTQPERDHQTRQHDKRGSYRHTLALPDTCTNDNKQLDKGTVSSDHDNASLHAQLHGCSPGGAAGWYNASLPYERYSSLSTYSRDKESEFPLQNKSHVTKKNTPSDGGKSDDVHYISTKSDVLPHLETERDSASCDVDPLLDQRLRRWPNIDSTSEMPLKHSDRNGCYGDIKIVTKSTSQSPPLCVKASTNDKSHLALQPGQQTYGESHDSLREGDVDYNDRNETITDDGKLDRDELNLVNEEKKNDEQTKGNVVFKSNVNGISGEILEDNGKEIHVSGSTVISKLDEHNEVDENIKKDCILSSELSEDKDAIDILSNGTDLLDQPKVTVYDWSINMNSSVKETEQDPKRDKVSCHFSAEESIKFESDMLSTGIMASNLPRTNNTNRSHSSKKSRGILRNDRIYAPPGEQGGTNDSPLDHSNCITLQNIFTKKKVTKRVHWAKH